MKRSRFTEDHRHLKEQEAGISVTDWCRKHDVSDATVHKWKDPYGGMDVGEATRLKGLKDENTRLKRLFADAMLDNAATKDLLGKKGSGPCEAASGRASCGGPWDERASGDRLLSEDHAV